LGFALWLIDREAWAAGTHEYKPMGTAVIAQSQLFRHRDFNKLRKPPSRRAPGFEGLFASLEDVNRHLQRPRAKKDQRILAVISADGRMPETPGNS
jgi:hypothetical protein